MIESWYTENNFDISDVFENVNDITLLLNSDKLETIAEKYVFQVAQFYMLKKNIAWDSNVHHVSFSRNIDMLTVDESAILSILIFPEENNNPIIFTNVDSEDYKYKDFPEENTVTICIPNRNNHIVFDSSKYYGAYSRKPLNQKFSSGIKINVWDHKPDNLAYYNATISEPVDINQFYLDTYQQNTTIHNETIYSSNLLEELLFNSTTSNVPIDNILSKYNSAPNTIIVNNTNNKFDYLYFTEKYGAIASDIYPFYDTNTTKIEESNRFYRKKIVQNILSHDVCYWIINECESQQLWNDNCPYGNYNTYLNLDKLPSITSFILYVCNFWLMYIRKTFDMESYNVNLMIRDIFISKFSKKIVNNDVKQVDNTFLVLTIYLNDKLDYVGGEIIFDNDEDQIVLNQGDMLIHNGKIARTKGDVSDGERYALVILVDIYP
jgi:hypothetical protein